MWKHLIFLCVALGFARLYELDISPHYQRIVAHIADDNHPLIIDSLAGAVVLILITLFTRASYFLGIIRLLIKLIQEVSFFTVTLISLGSIYWAIWEEGNPWQDLRPILPIPVVMLMTAVICINIIDFNQPAIKGLIPYAVVAATSFLVVHFVLI